MMFLNKAGFKYKGFPYFGWLIAIQSAVIKTAANFDISVIFYGEDGEIEYGGSTETKNNSLISIDYQKKIWFEGGYEKILNKLPKNLKKGVKYPVIDYIYPGPQIGPIRTHGFTTSPSSQGHALAELGFIVFVVDALGTPYRSKKFHDGYYADMGDNGLPDHISALRELAKEYPIDLDRVGIYGHSGGGFSSTDAILRHPDFFKVAVSGAGNHDNRGYYYEWGEKYQGLLKQIDESTDTYDSQANQNIAANLKGKLLLTYGSLDDNVHPNLTLLVADELIKHNKDFDMLVLPNRNHGYAREEYIARRTWDYFVMHLMGSNPPKEYKIEKKTSNPNMY